jgi:diaminohydroxyphosphoribosylaminopyrimidine deaminase / 5-amino-6-(5-phosphoribosylamino)uracil reductase
VNELTTSYLKQALALAELRRGFCAPNPSVGAILVKDKKIIASGLHWASGYPHAEVDALNKIDASRAKDTTLYVTLQPCCHIAKKTPPCTELLVAKGISKVIYSFRDPNPAVGKYTDQFLIQAGIPCIHHPLPEIDRFYESYQFWWQHQRPFVTAKLAISLDGKIAGPQGQRIPLTGKTAQRFTHQQRLHSDVILTTAKTINLDNPLLNVRLDANTYAKPIAILDSQLSLSTSAHIFHSAKNLILFYNATLVAQCEKKFSHLHVRCIPIACEQEGLNLLDILKQLGKEGYHDVWIEAGGRCFQAFAKKQLLQRAFIYVAPQCIGPAAQSAFTDAEVLFSAKPAPPFPLGLDACFEFNWQESQL